MKNIKQIALIGATASGKTGLAIDLAQKIDGIILSLDSLSIYKNIDIASAKPTKKERKNILHYGIDEIYPNENFDVTSFINLYKKAYNNAIKENKSIIIVGGTSFYLKRLLEGMSQIPKITKETKEKTKEALKNQENSYNMLLNLDKNYMKNISINDTYRIEKALNIYFQTFSTPTEYFKKNPPKPTITTEVSIFEIEILKEDLRKRVEKRTQNMLDYGLINEVIYLEKNYSQSLTAMKSIGIKETLAYLNGYINKKELKNQIATHTMQLAKRQKVFNNTQFKNIKKAPLKELYLEFNL